MKKIFWYITIGILLISIFTIPAFALELVRQKNVATYITFPIVDADGDIITGAAGLDSEIDQWTDAAAPNGFADCTNEATEINTTGEYYLSLGQAEMNTDYIIIQVKTSTSGAKTQHILIRTMVGDPLNIATTDDGGTINVTGGAVDTVTTTTTATNLTTNNDKTGYTVSTVSDKTGYSLTQAFPANFSALSISATTGLVDIAQTAADKVWGTAARTLTAGTNIVLAKGTGITGFNDITAQNVWEYATRVLTAGTNIALAKGTGVTGFNDITATDVWAAAARTLTAGTNIVLAKGTGITGFNDIAASDVASLILATPANKLATDASGRVTVGSNADKTGYSLSQSFPTNFVSLAITAGGAVTAGTVSDKTGYSLTQSFPANFGSLAITAAGKVTVGTNDDKTGYRLSEVGIDDILDELLSGHTTEGSLGKKINDIPVSGTGDWTANEKTEIKTILGVTNTGTPDDTPLDGVLKDIQDKVPLYNIGP